MELVCQQELIFQLDMVYLLRLKLRLYKELGQFCQQLQELQRYKGLGCRLQLIFQLDMVYQHQLCKEHLLRQFFQLGQVRIFQHYKVYQLRLRRCMVMGQLLILHKVLVLGFQF